MGWQLLRTPPMPEEASHHARAHRHILKSRKHAGAGAAHAAAPPTSWQSGHSAISLAGHFTLSSRLCMCVHHSTASCRCLNVSVNFPGSGSLHS